MYYSKTVCSRYVIHNATQRNDSALDSRDKLVLQDTRNNGGMIRSEWGFYDDIPGNTFAGTRLVLSFKHCNFEGNSFGAVSGGNPTGLIFARSQATELILEDSSFENNVFSLQQVQVRHGCPFSEHRQLICLMSLSVFSFL